MTLQVVARDGDAALLAEGEIGLLVSPRGHLVGLLGSIAAQGDWDAYDGPIPRGLSVTSEMRAEVEALRARIEESRRPSEVES